MDTEIAIIGMAGRFPGARHLREFHRNLQTGRDCVTEVTPQRFCDSTFPLSDEQLQVMGLLDQIDRFDRRFFNVSPREAEQMDPHQRLTLEVAYESIEDSGYSPASWNGREHAVIVADANYVYPEKIPEPDPSMYSGISTFTIAGRIARFFNTTGPNFVVDTGCSSGLVSVSLACDELALGRAEVALVAGAVLVLEPLPVEIDIDIGITSHDGKTRSFNANSNGSGVAEAVVSVVLKPLANARRDGDHVYAVIKSSAISSSAQSSASLTATSSAAQSNLLRQAWKRAGVDPLTIRYVEAHGSGTQLGDPIEIHGLDTAFRQFTDRRHLCAVSSVKSNIGHTDKVAGLSGLTKAALSVRHGELYPSLHFVTPNPLIDFANSATYINTALKPWTGVDGHPRRAGVNSFGFSGNNVHVVLEEYTGSAGKGSHANRADGPHLITVSSKRAEGVGANIAALAEFLSAQPETALADISFTRNTGREHFRHRAAFVARDTADLLAQLQAAADLAPAASAETVSLILLCSPDSPASPGAIEALQAAYPVFAAACSACADAWTGDVADEAFQRFTLQYALGRLLAATGVRTSDITGIGAGAFAVDALLEESPLADALRDLREADAEPPPADLGARLQALVAAQTEANPIVFIELGSPGCLARELQQLRAAQSEADFEVLTVDGETATCLADLLQQLYVQGGSVDWAAWHQHTGGHRISLPGYQFERLRSWYAPAHSREDYDAWYRRVYAANGTASAPATANRAPAAAGPSPAPARSFDFDDRWSPTEQQIAQIWIDTLKLDQVQPDDDFFELGGHSLFGAMVRNRIERDLRLVLGFRDIFAQNTVRKLAAYVDHRLAEGGAAVVPAAAAIPRLPAADHYPVSPAQFRLWVLDQKEGAMNQAYNVTIPLRLSGPLDADRMEQALYRLVERHETLRTHFIEVDGAPRQVVGPLGDFSVGRLSATEEELPATIETLLAPFDLARPPLVRAAIVRIAADSHVLFLDIHHTLIDGASYQILLGDLGTFYAGQTRPPLELSYKDYAAWRNDALKTGLMREAGAFWRELFAQPPEPLQLPTDFPRSGVRNYDGNVRTGRIEPEELRQLNALARQENASLFMVLLAGYSTLLAKYSGHPDVVVGSSVAGRSHSELEPLIGMFVNTVAFRTAPRDEFSFRDYLAAVREHCFKVYQYQDYPFETLLDQLDLTPDRSRNPLFDTLFVLQNFGLDPEPLHGDIAITAGEFDRHSAKFDLTFEGHEVDDGLNFNVEYGTALFRPETVDAIIADLFGLLAAVANDPDVRIGELSLDSLAGNEPAPDDDFSFATT